MQRQFARSVRLVCLTASIVSAATWLGDRALAAEEKPAAAGTLVVGGRPYKLTRAAAYETGSGDEALVTVIASDRNIPLDRIRKQLADDDGSDSHLSLSQPNLRVTFTKSGKVQFCQATADSGFFSTSGDTLSGEMKIEANRVVGKAALSEQGEGDLKRSFTLDFDVPLGLDAAAPRAKSNTPVKASVAGKFLGNGKPARLAFVSAQWREPFDGKPSLMLLFTEKDHSRQQRPDIKAGFGEFGSALIISMTDEGSVFGCEVAHAAHGRQPFSALGRIRTGEFDLGANYVKGQLLTDGQEDAFGKTWEVDLKFAAPLPTMASRTTPDAAPASKSRPAAKGTPTAKMPARQPAKATPPPAEAATLNVRDLALPEDVTDVEYKTIVEQLVFKSPAKVPALAADLGKRLAKQGWSGEGGDLVTAQSAILNRKRGEATLTIMAKPSGNGTQVTVFASGLDWEEKK